ncbi:MAG: hypothetical protein QOJ29_1799 [Thermoleophilaceae bacterium]|jgi:hypothetical protein|nr:hypothetical protein [Thermoleophilaceae bacterium]
MGMPKPSASLRTVPHFGSRVPLSIRAYQAVETPHV